MIHKPTFTLYCIAFFSVLQTSQRTLQHSWHLLIHSHTFLSGGRHCQLMGHLTVRSGNHLPLLSVSDQWTITVPPEPQPSLDTMNRIFSEMLVMKIQFHCISIKPRFIIITYEDMEVFSLRWQPCFILHCFTSQINMEMVLFQFSISI